MPRGDNIYNDPNQAFVATFTSSALSTGGAHDLLAMVSTSASRVELVAIELQQQTTTPWGGGIEIFRGSTSTPGGAAVTPASLAGWSTRAAVSAVNANTTAAMSTASAVRLFNGGFEADSGRFEYRPDPMATLQLNQRLHLRLAAPSVATAIAWAVTFREIGRIPG